MNFLKITFQEEAIDNLIDLTKKIILTKNKRNYNEEKDCIIFDSPVGSGKTFMCFEFMQRYLNLEENSSKNIGFVWLSPGTGNLSEQSKYSFKNFLFYSNYDIKINVLGANETLNQKKIKNKNLIVLNWESIKTKEKNVFRKKGEKLNLDDSVALSNLDEIIVFIDEAHNNADTTLSREVIELFNPSVLVKVTATPRKHINENNIVVKIEDVIESKFLKQEIIINDNVNSKIRKNLLESSIIKRLELEKTFLELNKDTIPLCLIQVENENGENKVSDILNELLELGVNRDEIGVWISDKKTYKEYEIDKDIIRNNDNNIRFLIFKQAIATGWDCPRAHILVKLRDNKSEIFDIQTLGRILRTTEKVHYELEQLNYAYIYTQHEKDELTIENYYDPKFKTKANIKDDFKAESYNKKILVASYIKKDFFKGIDSKNIYDEIKKIVEYLNNQKFDINEVFTTKMSKGGMSVNYLEEENLNDNIDDILSEEEVILSDDELKIIFIKNMKKFSKHNWIKILYDLLNSHSASNNSNLFVYKFYYKNKEYLNNELNDLFRKISQNKKEIKNFNYKTPEFVYYDEVLDLNKTSTNYIYDKEVVLTNSKSKSELLFANYLSHKAKYWWKNGVNGTSNFSRIYELENGEFKTYYPDFIAIDFKNNLFILDTKSSIGEKDYDYVKEKYKFGKLYESEQKEFLINAQGFNNVFLSLIKFTKETVAQALILHETWVMPTGHTPVLDPVA
jgi:type III restriction enzyme